MSYEWRVRINGICIITDDVARLRSFYTEALSADAEGDETFTAFRTDGAALSLFSTTGMERMAPGSTARAGVGRYTLEIEVDDVDAEFDRLNKLGCIVVKQPTTQSWGPTATSSTSTPTFPETSRCDRRRLCGKEGRVETDVCRQRKDARWPR